MIKDFISPILPLKNSISSQKRNKNLAENCESNYITDFRLDSLELTLNQI